jgi:hypothetical protein
MEHIYEEAVMWYVTTGGQRFVCPQFHIHGNGPDWAMEPDFVAVDFLEKTLYVIEVTASANVSSIVNKIVDNGHKAAKLLRENLGKNNMDFSDWTIKFRVFIRLVECDHFNKLIEERNVNDLDIKPLDIERTLAYWKWWDKLPGPINSLNE